VALRDPVLEVALEAGAPRARHGQRARQADVQRLRGAERGRVQRGRRRQGSRGGPSDGR
jgi:hypothetical protein